MRPLQLSRAVWVVPPLLFGPAVVYAQADSGAPASAELIAQARAQLRARQLDSAAVLLRRVTDAPARSPAERVQAWVLLGIVNFYSASDSAASDAFRQAFSLDPGLDVAGLDGFDPEIARLAGERLGSLGRFPPGFSPRPRLRGGGLGRIRPGDPPPGRRGAGRGGCGRFDRAAEGGGPPGSRDAV